MLIFAYISGLARAEGIRQSVLNKCPGDEEFVATAGKDWYKHKIKVNTLENKLDEVYPDSAWRYVYWPVHTKSDT